MRVPQLPSSLFAGARQRLAKLLPPGSVAILHANDIYPTNADGVMPYVQANDLFYLSGIDQEESILVFFPSAPDLKQRVMLFLRETNEQISIWEGSRLSKAEAAKRSGIPTESVHWLGQFETIFRLIMCQARQVFLNTNEHARATVEVETRDRRFIARCQREFPLHTYGRLAPLLHKLRMVKTPTEVAAVKRAIDVTEGAFRRLLGFVRPGVLEYEVEAEMTHEFIRRGTQGHAFSPIIACGANACVLHYVTNSARCQDGDLLLLDFGCRINGYNSDLTRTIPVNGKFSPRQKDVYEAVLRVQRAAKRLLKPGVLLKAYHEKVGLIMQEELVKLKLLTRDDVRKQDKAKPAYKRYFMHGTSHHLGLDVHDVGDASQKMLPGMIFTVEPGIYIREEGIGIRLENDVLITKTGTQDLMNGIPIEPDEIESLMAQKK